MDHLNQELAADALKTLRRIADSAPGDGNSLPHPSEYWGCVVAARRLLARVEQKAR